ncbi:MAG: ATP-binding protein [Chitinophagales bacterium]|nr:ATP-binding protein [Chitinophagales bacterium]
MKISLAICFLLLLTSSPQWAFAQCSEIFDDFIQPAKELIEQHPEEALTEVNKGIEDLAKLSCQKELGGAYSVKGVTLRNLGQFSEALISMDSALFIRNVLKDTIGISSVYNNISSIRLKQRDFVEAMAAALQAIELLQNFKGEHNPTYWTILGNSYINAANIFIEEGSLSNAEMYIQFAKDAQSKIGGEHSNLATANYNLALAFIAKAAFPEAEKLLLNNYNYYSIKEDTFNLAMTEDALGYLEHEKENFVKAREHFEKSIAFCQTIENHQYIITPQFNLATNYLKEEKPLKALEIIALVQLDEEESIERRLDRERIYIGAFAQMKQIDSLIKHVNVLDTLHLTNPNENEYIAEAKKRLEKNLAEAKIKLRKNSVSLYTLLIALVITALVSIILFLLKKGEERKKQAQQLMLEGESLEKRFMGKIADILIDKVSKKKIEINSVLHDNICPLVISVKRELEYFFKIKKEHVVQDAIGMLDMVYEQTRALIDGKETPPDSADWYKYMQLSISQFENLGHFEVKKHIMPEIQKISSDLGWQITFIISVLLDNIEIHSKAKQVSLDIIIENAHLIVMVEDDGIGFNINHLPERTNSNNKGIGLKNTKYRVEQKLSGKIKIDSILNEGTTINIKIPLNSPQKS